jgi:hypothetical protein
MGNTVPFTALWTKKKRRTLPFYHFLMLSYGGRAEVWIRGSMIHTSRFATLADGLLLALLQDHIQQLKQHMLDALAVGCDTRHHLDVRRKP